MTQLQIEPKINGVPRPRRGGWVFVVLAVAAGLGLAAVLGLRYGQDRAVKWGVVEPGRLYRSAQIPRRLMREKLEENKIGRIIYLSNEKEGGDDLAAEIEVAKAMKIDRTNLPLNGDGVGDPRMYTDAVTAICQANSRGTAVLVHCHSGAQRTGGVIAVYRMLVERKPPQEAYAEMLQYGYDPKGNPQLVAFLNRNMALWAAALQQRRIIDHVPEPIPRISAQMP